MSKKVHITKLQLDIARESLQTFADAPSLDVLFADLQVQLGERILLDVATAETAPSDYYPSGREQFNHTVYFLAGENGVYTDFPDADGNPVRIYNEIVLLMRRFGRIYWEKIVLYSDGERFTIWISKAVDEFVETFPEEVPVGYRVIMPRPQGSDSDYSDGISSDSDGLRYDVIYEFDGEDWRIDHQSYPLISGLTAVIRHSDNGRNKIYTYDTVARKWVYIVSINAVPHDYESIEKLVDGDETDNRQITTLQKPHRALTNYAISVDNGYVMVDAVSVIIGNRIYGAPATLSPGIELEQPDAGLSRIDVVAVQIVSYDEETEIGVGEIIVVTGEDAQMPVKPVLPYGTVELGEIHIPAGLLAWSTNITDEIIYDEGDEWAASKFGVNPVTIDVESTEEAQSGTKSIDIGEFGSEDAIGARIMFVAPQNKDRRGYGVITAWVKLKEAAPSGSLQMSLQFWYSETGVYTVSSSSLVEQIQHDVTDWQQVQFRVKEFAVKDWFAEDYLYLMLTIYADDGFAGLYVDNIVWGGGVSKPLPVTEKLTEPYVPYMTEDGLRDSVMKQVDDAIFVEGQLGAVLLEEPGYTKFVVQNEEGGLFGYKTLDEIAAGIEWGLVDEDKTLAVNEGAMVETDVGEITLTLPATPEIGDTVGIADIDGSASTNNIIVDGNGGNIQGDSTLTIDVDNAYLFLTYTGEQWMINNYMTQAVPDYLGLLDLTENVLPKMGAEKLTDSLFSSVTTTATMGVGQNAQIKVVGADSEVIITTYNGVSWDTPFRVLGNTVGINVAVPDEDVVFHTEGDIRLNMLPAKSESTVLVVDADGYVGTRELSAVTGNYVDSIDDELATSGTTPAVDNANNTIVIKAERIDTSYTEVILGGMAAYKPWFGYEDELPETRNEDTLYFTYLVPEGEGEGEL